MALHPDLVAELRQRFRGDIRQDLASRVLYSTDASIYQIEPAGVLLPRTADDLQVAVELAARYHVSVVPRGAGTSLAGQAIGDGLILDCSRWLNRILDIDAEARTARVEPGVVLADLNRAARRFGLEFGPDPASAERATMGGVVANNATGAHSILHGMTADHVVSARAVLADGAAVELGPVPPPATAEPLSRRASRWEAIVAAARLIRSEQADEMRRHFPTTWRNSAGYRLNYLLPWAPSRPPGWTLPEYPAAPASGEFNLAQLLAGSEGTLAVIQDVTVALVPRAAHTLICILSFDNVAAACDAIPSVLRSAPSAIELVPRLILQAARRLPGLANRMAWLQGDPAAILLVEYAGQDLHSIHKQAGMLGPQVQIVDEPEEQAMVWDARKAGLGLLDARGGPSRPTSFIEDCAIPVERLGEFVQAVQNIMKDNAAVGGIYGHASAGCLHIRPVLNLKSEHGVTALRRIAKATFEVALRLGGSMSSEHGDGIVRGEWLRRTYGDRLANAMLSLKQAADPDGILNPGKMLDAPPMDTKLRYGTSYRTDAWQPMLHRPGGLGLDEAIERCNGQGVCRKDAGVMCPSFQATREEINSTRGRANLLRALIAAVPAPGSRAWPRKEVEEATHMALDLCLSCKGCLGECPSGVDMAGLKSEFLNHYYRSHPRPFRDYVFGYFGLAAGLLASLSPLVQLVLRIPGAWTMACQLLGVAADRPLPHFRAPRLRRRRRGGQPSVLLLRDAYSHYVDSDVEQAAIDLLEWAGLVVQPVRVVSACAALISKGFLAGARRHAERVLSELRSFDAAGTLPVVVVEPSELEALRFDAPALIPAAASIDCGRLARLTSVEELLLGSGHLPETAPGGVGERVLFLPHCHERAHAQSDQANAEAAAIKLLTRCGYAVETIDAGCCGMGGTFGFESEHYALSQKIGGLRLFHAIDRNKNALISATGGACRLQIVHGTGRVAEHPIVLAWRALARHDTP